MVHVPGNHSDTDADDENTRPELEFWRMVEAGQRPDLHQFVERIGVSDPRTLAELIQLDQLATWRRGEARPVEHYFEVFPDLDGQTECQFDLIYHEFLLREEIGESPDCEQYAVRFPHHADRLRMQVDLHQALNEHPLADDLPPLDAAAGGFSANNDSSQRCLPRVTGFEITEVLGRGGMGVVYKARQIGLNRWVALKMLWAGDLAGPDQLKRLRSEAEAAARLHHPNIVQIYDLGEHEGLPYLSLEYVNGGTLAGRLLGEPMEAHEAAHLILALARAIHFAHQRGIVHRDLKPANVLLEVVGDSDSADDLDHTNSVVVLDQQSYTPKVADFGLAKFVLDQLMSGTESGALLGTPSYMAPEQAAGRVDQLGPAVDIYALGAILYELLTGRPPFKAATLIETIQLVVGSDPVSVSRLQPRTPRDLATICLKCLDRTASRRYASAGELADDLQRFLNDEPIRARRTTSVERTFRWCRRNPVLAVMIGVAASLLIAVASISSYFTVRLSSELKNTSHAEAAQRLAKHETQLSLWDSQLAEAAARSASRRVGQRFEALQAIQKASQLLPQLVVRANRTARMRDAAIACLALPDLRRAETCEVQVDVEYVSGVSNSGSFAFRDASGDLVVRQFGRADDIARVAAPADLIRPLLSSDGRYLAAYGQSSTIVWRLRNGAMHQLHQFPQAIHPTFSPDSRHIIVAATEGGARLVDLESGQTVTQLQCGQVMSSFVFDPAGRQVAVCESTSIRMMDLATGQSLQELPGPKLVGPVYFPNLAWHASGQFLAAGPYDEGVVLWNVETATRQTEFPHRGQVMHLAMDPESDFLLVSTTWTGLVSLWHVGTGKHVLQLPSTDVLLPDQAPTENLRLIGRRPGALDCWELEPAAECRFLPLRLVGSRGDYYNLSISPDGQLLAVSCEAGFELWSLATRQRLAAVPIAACRVRFNEHGDLITITSRETLRWPRHARSTAEEANVQQIVFGPPEQLFGEIFASALDTTPDNRVTVMMVPSGECRVHFADDPDKTVWLDAPGDYRSLSVSPNGRWVAMGGWETPGARVYEAATGQLVAELPVGRTCVVRFSPDSRWLVTSPNGVELWDTKTWKWSARLDAEGSAASGLSFDFLAYGRCLAVAQPNGVIRLTDPNNGKDYATIGDPRLIQAFALTASPDGKWLAGIDNEGEGLIQVWDLAAVRRNLDAFGLDWNLPAIATVAAAPSMADVPVTVDDGGLVERAERAAEARELVEKSHDAVTRGNLDEALALLRQAVQSDPSSALAHNNLAWLLVSGPERLRDPETALASARTAVELEPHEAIYRNTLGVALYRNGDWQGAVEVLEANLADNPLPGFDLYFLAMCYAQLNDEDAYRDRLQRAIDWHQSQLGTLSAEWKQELDAFRREAEK